MSPLLASDILSTFILISHIVFVVGFLAYLFSADFRKFLEGIVAKHVVLLLFLFSLAATLGSLFYSNIIGYPPCELCWIQRIFMYPQALLVGIALWKRDKGIVDYLLPMSILGGIVALYHSVTHYGLGDGLIGCTSVLGDCGKLYVFEYGYITIPLMSFTAFAYLIAISVVYYRSKHARGER